MKIKILGRTVFERVEEVQNTTPEVKTNSEYYGGSSWIPVRDVPFDGEKTVGELGNVINLFPDFWSLRLRAYEAELKSDVVKIITGKFFKWVIGNGLKLQSEPNELVLQSEGINEDFTKFKPLAEARFSIYASSKFSSYSGMYNLHKLANDAYKCAFLGGDCLVIQRVVKGVVNVQVIDGQEVQTPFLDGTFLSDAQARGNTISHGIEISPTGEHVAFFVRNNPEGSLPTYTRVEAKGKETGRLMAWMVYGSKHRINHHRGIPNITAILEKIEKLDRYTEATVGGAEERAKIAYAIKHSRFSTGENIAVGTIKKSLGVSTEDDPYGLAHVIAKNIQATTNKQTFNLPIGAELTSLDSSMENQYPEFFDAVFTQLCAASDIPPEVAMQKYSSNYSASRAAINGWGYIVDVYRKDFSDNFYRPIYNLWLEVEILKNKISASGYIKALQEDNYMAMQSYSNCKFTGVNMPHIDPLKEVKAIREMLGNPNEGIAPLISYDQAAEALNQGDWAQNYAKFLEEDKSIVKPVQPVVPDASPSQN